MNWPRSRLELLAVDDPYAFVGGPFGSKLTSRDYVDYGVPVIRGSNLNNGRYLDMSQFVFVSEAKVREDLSGNLARPGDLVFTQRGTLGQVAIIPNDGISNYYVVSQSQMKLTVDDEKADTFFLYYYMSSREAVQRILNFTSSSGVPHINLKILRNFEVPVPPVERQISIASTLSAYDDQIENNQRRIQLLEQSARLLYKEWFVHLRFPGHEHVKIKDGVPQGWTRKPLGEVAATNVRSYNRGSLPNCINYIEISGVDRGRIVARKPMLSAEGPGRARRIVRSGDTIWSNVRPNLRAYALVLDPDECDVFSTGFTVLSPTAVPSVYLYLSITTDEFTGHLVNHTTGASYPAVRPDDFERAIVLIPSTWVLEVFQERTEPLYRLVNVLEKEMRYLSEARDRLLPHLLSGRPMDCESRARKNHVLM